jgi:hypothetical protein
MTRNSQKFTWYNIAQTGTDIWESLAGQAKKDDPKLGELMQGVSQAMSAVATYLKSRLET